MARLQAGASKGMTMTQAPFCLKRLILYECILTLTTWVHICFYPYLSTFQSFFAERFFALFDKDGGGTIDLAEMMEGLNMLTKGTKTEKLKFLFDVYDVDGKPI